jgi:hypothetical protein
LLIELYGVRSGYTVSCPVYTLLTLVYSICFFFGIFYVFVLFYVMRVCVYVCVCAFCPVLHYSILLDGDSVCAARDGM